MERWIAFTLAALVLLMPAPAALAAPPGDGPAALFEPDAISTTGDEFFGIAFSADGREAYWDRGTIWFSRLENGSWQEPRPMDFTAKGCRDTKPVLARDGSTMVFASDRPLADLTPAGRTFLNLWIARRTEKGWEKPRPLPAAINTEWDEDFPVLASDGTLYFVSNRKGDHSTYEQYRCRPDGARYLAAEEFRFPFQQENEALSYIAPDSSCALFAAVRDGGCGSVDVYASFRDEAGAWSAAIPAGPAVNSAGVDWCARISPDGRYLFFSSERGNRRGIYRVNAQAIRSLKPKAAGCPSGSSARPGKQKIKE